MRRLRNRLAGALLSVLALALTATGCGDSSRATSGAGVDSATAPVEGSVSNRVEPLARTPEPRLPVTVRSADGEQVR